MDSYPEGRHWLTSSCSRQGGLSYRVLEDSVAEAKSLLRVVDESGEDYLFPAELFVAIEIPENAEPAFTSEASTAT